MTEEARARTVILRGGLSAGGGLTLRLGARLVFLAIAAQLFGATLFGAFSLAVAIVELAVAIGGLGMKRYIFKLFEERGERSEAHVLLDVMLLVVSVSFALGALIALATIALTPAALAEQTAVALFWLTPMVAGQALLDIVLAATRWRHRMRYEVVGRSVIEPYVGAAAAVAAYLAGFTAGGLVIGYSIGTLAALCYTVLGARSCFGGFGLGSYRPEARRLIATLRASGSPTATDAVAGFFTRADLYVVGVLLGEAAAGVYAMARQLKTPIRQVRQSYDGMLTPIVARTLSADGPASATAAIASATRMILALQLALFLALLAVGQPVLAWFGSEFAPAYPALLILAAAETVQGAFSISDLLLLYLRARLALVVTAGMIVVYLASAVPLTVRFGIDGAALAMFVATCAGALLRRELLQRRLALATPLLHSAGPMFAAAAASAAAIALHRVIPPGAAPAAYIGVLAGVLAIYWAGIRIWQRATGETLQLTGFRAA